MSRVAPVRRVVCLGEALVDFVCERPVDSFARADSFVAHPGGSLPNIAVCAARFGAAVEILGGAGEDEWGRWARERIAAEGVDVERFHLLPGIGTSHAFVVVGTDGEPTFAFYGDAERPAASAAPDIDGALGGQSGVLVVGSDTLLGRAERDVTTAAAITARDRGWQVLCDPNLRPDRWPSREAMVTTIRDLVALSSIVKLNEAEALMLTGEDSAESASNSLRELGPDAVLVTRGDQGALLTTKTGHASAGAQKASLVDATGAGDCVAGVLAAAMAAGTRPTDLGRAVGVAMFAAARVIEEWGAWAGLPEAADARSLLAAALA